MSKKTKRKIARYSLKTVLIVVLIAAILATLCGFIGSFGCVRGTVDYVWAVQQYGASYIDFTENMTFLLFFVGTAVTAADISAWDYLFSKKAKKGGK